MLVSSSGFRSRGINSCEQFAIGPTILRCFEFWVVRIDLELLDAREGFGGLVFKHSGVLCH